MFGALQRDAGDLAACEALLERGQPEQALALLTAAHQASPERSDCLTLMGHVLGRMGQHRAAVGALMLALQADPRSAAAHERLVTPLIALGELDTALRYAREAFRLAPNALNATTLSCALWTLCRHEEALLVVDAALEMAPDLTNALLNRALALQGLGRFEEALATGQRAVAVSPGHAHARMHLAEQLLAAGCMTPESWELYEARIAINGFKPTSDIVLWSGEDLSDKTILLQAEQGMGDTLQFVRYAPMVRARARRVVLAVQYPLYRLLQGTPGADEVVLSGSNPPPFDFVSPLLSLPGRLGTTLDTIPPALLYKHHFPPRRPDGTLRVGLAWAGNPSFVHDQRRSVDPALLAALAGLERVQFFNLQIGAKPDSFPPDLAMTDLMAGVRDFLDTAERIAGLDLVVAVDTAVVHLAATMGKPTWVLSRHLGCWRWMHGTTHSPWYPTVRLYRQQRPHDWEGVLRRVRADLAALAESLPQVAEPLRSVA